MNAIGTVLVFKPEVSKEEATKALEGLADFLQPNWIDDKGVSNQPFRLEEFDDEYGGPVWYLP